jgi:hypothetical protein
MMNIQFFNFLNFDGARRWCPVALGSRYGSVTAICQNMARAIVKHERADGGPL